MSQVEREGERRRGNHQRAFNQAWIHNLGARRNAASLFFNLQPAMNKLERHLKSRSRGSGSVEQSSEAAVVSRATHRRPRRWPHTR